MPRFVISLAFSILLTGSALAQDDLNSANPPTQTNAPKTATSPKASKLAEPVPLPVGEVFLEGNYPDLKDYLSKTGYLTSQAEFTAFRTGPISPTGSLKSIFALQFSDLGNCGSIGCTQIIITQTAQGLFTLYDEIVGGNLSMSADQTANVHDLTTKTPNGLLVGRFNKTKYIWSLAEKPVVTTTRSEEIFPLENTGRCIQHKAWHSYRISPTEAAAGFGYCRTNREENLLLFTCSKGDPLVRITMNMSTRELDDSKPVNVRLSLAGLTFTLSGTAYYDVMSGFVLPELTPIALESGLFDALAKPAKSLSMSIDDHETTLHLQGAVAAIKPMIETCR